MELSVVRHFDQVHLVYEERVAVGSQTPLHSQGRGPSVAAEVPTAPGS